MIAFYSDNEEFNNSTYFYYSANFIKISYTSDDILEENEIKFFTNNISFTYSSISTQLNSAAGGGSFKLSVNTDNMTYKSFDYITSSFNNDKISLMNISNAELQQILDIFVQSNSDDYYQIDLDGTTIYMKDFTFEQAVEFVLYVISSTDLLNKDIFIDELLRNTIKDESTNNKETLLGSKFETLLTSGSGVTISVSTDNSFDIPNSDGVDGYIIGFVLNIDKSIEIVTKNVVYYEVNSNTLPYSVISISEKIDQITG